MAIKIVAKRGDHHLAPVELIHAPSLQTKLKLE
jgi:hypothetical protein